MRSTKSKNQNNQLPAQVEADQITINEDDVNYAIKKLSLYDDCYSTGILKVFSSYLKHKDYKRMRDEIEIVPHSDSPCHILWDINANIGFLEVIYPTVPKKGGLSC